jgi:hypothetical protein
MKATQEAPKIGLPSINQRHQTAQKKAVGEAIMGCGCVCGCTAEKDKTPETKEVNEKVEEAKELKKATVEAVIKGTVPPQL